MNKGAAKWNAATDQFGNKTAFYFQVNQAGGPGQADYIITKGNLVGQTAATDIFHYPYVTTIDAHLANINLVSLDSASGSVAHELAHGIGVGDYSFSKAFTRSSVARDWLQRISKEMTPEELSAASAMLRSSSKPAAD